MIQRFYFTTLLFGIGLIACQDNQKNSALFSKVSSSQSGINFENTLVDSDDFNIIEYLYFYNGGGVALGTSTMMVSQIFTFQRINNPINFTSIGATFISKILLQVQESLEQVIGKPA